MTRTDSNSGRSTISLAVRGGRLAVLVTAFLTIAKDGSAAADDAVAAALKRDFATIQRKADEGGIPVMVSVSTRPVYAPLADRRVVRRTRWFLTANVAPTTKLGKALTAESATVVAFLDGKGEVLGRCGPKDSAEQLLAAMKKHAREARAVLLEKLANAGTSEAELKTALDGVLRMGAVPRELVPLVIHKSANVRTAIKKALALAPSDAVALAAWDGLSSADAGLRAECYRLAIAAAPVPKVPGLEFWQKGPEDERKTALAQWRETALIDMGPVNRDILEFVDAYLGKKVSDGQSPSLAMEAFRAAEAKKEREVDGQLVWGREVKGNQRVLPGDVIQMYNCRFKSGDVVFQAAVHTQIVLKVLAKGRYEVLEQNVNDRRTVAAAIMDMSTVTDGTVKIYRPQLP
jgi:hypothetical protein